MGTQLVHNGKTTLYASHPLGNWGFGAIKLGDSTYKLLGVSNMIHISTDLGMEIVLMRNWAHFVTNDPILESRMWIGSSLC